MRSEDLNPATRAALEAAGHHLGKLKTKESREELFEFQAKALGLPAWRRNLRFALEALQRHWMFDFGFADYRVAVEIEGLVVRRVGAEQIVFGRHASIEGMRGDMRKYNAAAQLGWLVTRYEQTMVDSGEAIAQTERVLLARGWKPAVPR